MDITRHNKHFIPRMEMKDYNVMAKGKHFDLLIKLMERSNENFANLALGHGDNHARGCLLDLKNS